MASSSSFHLWTQIFGHAGDVKSVAACDDARVATASRDGSVRQWRLGEDSVGVQIATHAAHRGYVNCVLVRATHLLSGGVDGALVIWRHGEAEPTRQTDAHAGNICCLAPLASRPDDVATGSWDHTAKLWRWTGHAYELVRTFDEPATVWCVLSLSETQFLTGSADKSIRLYDPRSGALLRKFDSHTDCVRALMSVPEIGFLSAANDARILLWSLDGAVLREFAAHSAYIYSLAPLGAGQFASSGEDKMVHVWSIDASEPLQSLRVPGSAWCVAPYRHVPRDSFQNSAPESQLIDLMCASAEGVVHVFTRDAARVPPPELLVNFEAAVEEAFAPPKRGGDIDVSQYPSREDGLRAKGTRDGQNRIVAHEGLAEVWSWSVAADEWQHIGYAEGTAADGGADGANGSGDGKILDGVRYDFVFDVDIDTGSPLKLGYSHGQDPYTVAQQFIWKNQLEQGSLPTIVDFIVRNTGAVIKASHTSVDPLTRGRTLPDVVPVRQYVLFKAGTAEPIVAKALELYGTAHLTASQTALLHQLAAFITQRDASGPSAAHIALLVDMLQWPTEALFPVLDLARLAMLHSIGGATLRSAIATALHRVATSLAADAASVPGGLQLVAARTCANWIAAVATANAPMEVDGAVGESVNFASVARLAVQFVTAFRHVSGLSRNVALARASILLNIAVVSLKEAFGDAVKASCWSETQRALASEKDADVQYSLLGALGTLLYHDAALFRTASAGGVRDVVSKFDSSTFQAKVTQLAQELCELMTDLER